MAGLKESVGETLQLLRGLTVYRGVLRDPTCRAYLKFWKNVQQEGPAGDLLELFGDVFYRLSLAAGGCGEQVGDAWQNHLLELILKDDNAFTRGVAAARLEDLGRSLAAGAAGDLRRLQGLYGLGAGMAREAVLNRVSDSGSRAVELPAWENLKNKRRECAGQANSFTSVKMLMARARDWGELLPDLAAFHASNGSGIFATYRAFRWVRGRRGGRLVGIAEPDPLRLDDLVGYESQRAELLANTEMFLAGYPANNVLIYGDRGTGKSSTVKALLHEYAGRGLRLVEIAKRDLGDYNRVTAVLRQRPQRFILFVDDLSFEETEVEYKKLKAILEGGLESRPPNVLIYATSNRRHLVREFFSDRDGAPLKGTEVRRNDTVQEKLSLADRFGITVLFTTPDRALYLEMVRKMAGKRGLNIEDEELKRRALQWEIRHNGRSGRTARQFIDHLAGECSFYRKNKH